MNGMVVANYVTVARTDPGKCIASETSQLGKHCKTPVFGFPPFSGTEGIPQRLINRRRPHCLVFETSSMGNGYWNRANDVIWYLQFSFKQIKIIYHILISHCLWILRRFNVQGTEGRTWSLNIDLRASMISDELVYFQKRFFIFIQ